LTAAHASWTCPRASAAPLWQCPPSCNFCSRRAATSAAPLRPDCPTAGFGR
ncbi:unnamed protein product, partial [Effrenium voratum]